MCVLWIKEQTWVEDTLLIITSGFKPIISYVDLITNGQEVTEYQPGIFKRS